MKENTQKPTERASNGQAKIIWTQKYKIVLDNNTKLKIYHKSVFIYKLLKKTIQEKRQISHIKESNIYIDAPPTRSGA